VREATLNGYSQVTFETNRYSVPTDKARKHLTLKAYPFHIEILAEGEVIARHERSYARKQDILDPLHYLPLLAQRPGAFDHAQPLHAWRQAWPEAYEQLLEKLKAQHGAARGVKAFIQVLQLHQHHAALLGRLPGYCLNRLLEPPSPPQQMAHPPEGAVDIPIPAPTRYDALLPGGTA
jgi:hypothetical protein